jgi:predicted O-methyltransferase YrrM
MGQIVPDAVEQYLEELNRLADPVLLELQREGKEQNLPIVDAEVGALLRVLATTAAATRILEIGTAIGYSSIWLAGALPPDGMLVTLEIDQDRARIARQNVARAGLAERVNVVVGDAQKSLKKIAGPFDVIFQDGDKHQYEPMLDRLVDLLRPRGLLITDNVLWSGEVVPRFTATLPPDDGTRLAISQYNKRISHDPRLMTTIVPIRDGVAISMKKP